MRKKVALVTGASRGLGAVTVCRLASEQFAVVINYNHQEEKAQEVAAKIIGRGGEAITCQADISSKAAVERMVSAVLAKWEQIDLLINNAGVINDAILANMRITQWEEVLEVNLHGTFHCLQTVSQEMMERKTGHIINIASLAGMRGARGQSNYAAAKAALIALTKSAARELGRYNIKVNALIPGFLTTDLTKNVPPEITARAMEENVLGQSQNTSEVADFIVHLTKMNNVSGQVFNLDSRIGT